MSQEEKYHVVFFTSMSRCVWLTGLDFASDLEKTLKNMDWNSSWNAGFSNSSYHSTHSSYRDKKTRKYNTKMPRLCFSILNGLSFLEKRELERPFCSYEYFWSLRLYCVSGSFTAFLLVSLVNIIQFCWSTAAEFPNCSISSSLWTSVSVKATQEKGHLKLNFPAIRINKSLNNIFLKCQFNCCLSLHL